MLTSTAAFVLFSADISPSIPSAWASKRPSYLHQFRVFNSDEKGSKGIVPRPAKGLYESIGPGDPLTAELTSSSSWAAIPNEKRLISHCPVLLLDGLVMAISGRLLEQCPPGVLQILHLHGPEYILSSATARTLQMLHQGYPTYSIAEDYSVLAGGIHWYSARTKERRDLPCNKEIAVSALQAASYSRRFHTLAFGNASPLTVAILSVH